MLQAAHKGVTRLQNIFEDTDEITFTVSSRYKINIFVSNTCILGRFTQNHFSRFFANLNFKVTVKICENQFYDKH